MLLRTLSIWLVLLTLPVHLALAQIVPIPPLTGPVTDQVGVLTPEVRETLERELVALKKEKGSEVAVLIVPSTKPEEIEQYSIRVVENWKLGRKGIDDGALLLVATNDRRVRIEVGRGLEGDIPDVKAFRIIEEIILPRFKQGDVSSGVLAGTRAIVGLIRGMDLPRPTRGSDDDLGWIVFLVGLGTAVGNMAGVAAGIAFGAIVGGFVTIALGLLVLPLGLSLALGAVAGVFVIISSLVRTSSNAGAFGGRSSYGDSSSTWHSGGSFGGGDSFGGGGSFSGGGASGRW